ncbi:MAG: hypothetical protein EOM21_18655, partial [Gammaproteobacteria bacterium]|nr:hypothetical protein [Gammaproteobacteria bacterium]
MARLPKSQGQGGFTAEQLRKISRDNTQLAMDLSASVRGLGRKALAAMAATALYKVIEYTHHDSSRFAANWDLAFNRDGYREQMQPWRYGESPAGQRDDKGANKQATQAAKHSFYQYFKHPSGAYLPLPQGYLWGKIGLGGQVGTPFGGGTGRPQLGALPRVELFNPLISSKRQRLDGSGHSYAFNALYGKSVGGGDLTVAETEVANLVGEGYLP